MNAPQPQAAGILTTVVKGALVLAVMPVVAAVAAMAGGFQTEPRPLTFREKVRNKFRGVSESVGNTFRSAGEKIRHGAEEKKAKREENKAHMNDAAHSGYGATGLVAQSSDAPMTFAESKIIYNTNTFRGTIPERLKQLREETERQKAHSQTP